MNGATTSFVPEMLNCVDANMTVLERQRAGFKCQQQQHHHHHHQQQQQQQREEELIGYYNNVEELGGSGGGLLGEVVTRSYKPDPVLNGWPDLGGCFGRSGVSNVENGVGLDENFGICMTCSCPPLPGSKEAVVPVGGQDKVASGVGDGARASLKKRKADKVVVAEEESRREKMSKGCKEDGESKTTEKSTNNNNKKENSGETSKDNHSKVTEVQKPGYIHVRARPGQATDSHSLAERVRREKISERMRYLQDLVPGCNKITGKAGMLDEIINYVQSLQKQVEFLSMKLAAVNPRIDFNIDNFSAKEAFPGCSTNFPMFGMSTDMNHGAYLQLNLLQEQVVTCSGLDIGINHLDMGLRRTITAPTLIPEAFIDPSCFNQMQQIQPIPTWDADVQNLCNVAFDQGRQATLLSQPFTGPIQAGNLKMEM